tara:strand:- start:252 stop:395 length:144 start_codon:yes stop_codon:yes gene_type:complete
MSLSIKKTFLAPLDAASKPKAPLPENKSAHTAFLISSLSQLNNVSRI